MYIVQFNDGRPMTVPMGEARFWAWVGLEYITCNVFKQGGNGTPLSPFDIY